LSFGRTPGIVALLALAGAPVNLWSYLDAWSEVKNLARLDAIKSDVEGMGLDVLQGAEKLISRFRPAIIVEADTQHQARNGTSFEQLTQWLSSHQHAWELASDCWTQTDPDIVSTTTISQFNVAVS
jgi:hypothetical protein